MVVPVGQSDTVQNLIRVRRLETGSSMRNCAQCGLCPWSKGWAKARHAQSRNGHAPEQKVTGTCDTHARSGTIRGGLAGADRLRRFRFRHAQRRKRLFDCRGRAPGQRRPPAPDARGVITYPDYQVVVARADDTVQTVAQRLGQDPAALARHNALTPDTRCARARCWPCRARSTGRGGIAVTTLAETRSTAPRGGTRHRNRTARDRRTRNPRATGSSAAKPRSRSPGFTMSARAPWPTGTG